MKLCSMIVILKMSNILPYQFDKLSTNFYVLLKLKKTREFFCFCFLGGLEAGIFSLMFCFVPKKEVQRKYKTLT